MDADICVICTNFRRTTVLQSVKRSLKAAVGVVIKICCKMAKTWEDVRSFQPERIAAA